jgi:hypothetical protein
MLYNCLYVDSLDELLAQVEGKENDYYYIVDPTPICQIKLVKYLKSLQNVLPFIEDGSRILIIPKTCKTVQIKEVLSAIIHLCAL